MIGLVSLEEAKLHLHISDDYEDLDLTLEIQGGSAATLPYIQGSRALVIDNSGELVDGEPLTRVQTALLVLLGYLDRNHGGREEDKSKRSELPFSVSMLIYDLRRPTIIQGTDMACAGCAGRREWTKKWTRIAYERAAGRRTNGGTESAGNISTGTSRNDKPLGSG